MKKGDLIVVGIVVLIIIVGFLALTNRGNEREQGSENSVKKCNSAPCLAPYFYLCNLSELTMVLEGKSIKVEVLGYVNERCHFKMSFENVTGADCYFRQEDLTEKVLNQMFGNQEGQDAIILESCIK